MLKFASYSLVFASVAAALGASAQTYSPEAVATKVSSRQPAGLDFTGAAESTINGVVSIKSFATVPSYNPYQGGEDMFNDPFFDFFFGVPRQQQRQPKRRNENKSDESAQRELGLGSGVIVSPEGYIVTNNHVIAQAERLEVTLNDNRVFNATVIGADEATDLALIKIDAENLHVIPFGDSDELKIGEWVLAVGNPFGLTSTVTAGIVSAKARSISNATNARRMGIESYIQTDAAVNPGNSGGALVNMDGELVGINTAIYSQTGNYAGYSFAIPTSIVVKIAKDLKEFGAVQRAVLGVSYTELNAKVAKEKGITAVNDGLIVEEVSDRSAAMEAGIKPGDVIIAINGNSTRNSSQLMEQMARLRPGDKATVTYIRDNREHTVTITLYDSTGGTKLTAASNVSALGCAFKKPSEETRAQLRISGGMQVVGLKDGKFKEAGIKDGFIITDINNMRVTSQDDIEKIYNAIVKSSDADHVMFITGIYPTGKKVYYAVDLSD